MYATFTGTIAWDARLWGAVLYAGPGALLSHETAAEVLCLTDRRFPVIQVTIPENRRVRAPQGVRVHRSSLDYPRWRPLRGIPPHTFYADTIIDLAAAADNRDDVVAWISRGIHPKAPGQPKRSSKAAVAARSRLRWRDQLEEIVGTVAGGVPTSPSNTATTAMSSAPTAYRQRRGRQSSSWPEQDPRVP